MRYLLIFCLFPLMFGTFTGCKSDKNQWAVPEIEALENEYKANPSDEKFAEIVNKLGELIQDTEGKEGKKRFILKGLSFTKENNKDDFHFIFVKEFLKYFHEDKEAADYLWSLSDYLIKNNAIESASILRSGFKNKYPSDRRTEDIKVEVIKSTSEIDPYIKQKAEAIFINPDETGLNNQAVTNYIDACESIVLAFPKDSMCAEYLFRAAEMARSVRAFPKSLSIYDWLLTSHPEYDKVSLVFFLRGFIYENEMKNKPKAAAVYSKFLEKFPNDPMVSDVRFLLENIDKTEDEMIKLIEERQKTKDSLSQIK